LEAAAVLEQTKIVWPSGLLLAARSAAIAPLAPGLFSTTTGTPKVLFSPSATLRAAWSVAEPGPNGTRDADRPVGKAVGTHEARRRKCTCGGHEKTSGDHARLYPC
jgi:hypothetical protein